MTYPALAWAAVAAGLVLLYFGGETLIQGSVKLARRLGLSPLVVGLTVVAFGTSAPELGVSLQAALGGHPDLALGNVVGSNIANIGLILGLAALIRPLPVNLHVLRLEVPLLLLVSGAMFLPARLGAVERWGGLTLLGVFVVYTALLVRRARRKSEPQAAPEFEEQYGDQPATPLPLSTAMVLAGLVLLSVGAKALVSGSVELATRFGVPETVIGLTLAAVGTSLPELAASIAAARKNQGDIVVGNIVGSNVFNLLIVLGSTAAVQRVTVDPVMLWRDLPVMLVATLALVPTMRTGVRVGRVEGLAFLAGYVAYNYLLFRTT